MNLSGPGPLAQLGAALEQLRKEAARPKPSPLPAPVAKAAKPIVGLGLAAGAKRPGAKMSAPNQPPPPTDPS